MSIINTIHTSLTASISELKKDPMGVLSGSNGSSVAILNRNTPVFYLVPAEAYEEFVAQKNQKKDAH